MPVAITDLQSIAITFILPSAQSSRMQSQMVRDLCEMSFANITRYFFSGDQREVRAREFVAIQVDDTLELPISLSNLYIIGSHAGYFGMVVYEDG